jgi:hypothetical protein
MNKSQIKNVLLQCITPPIIFTLSITISFIDIHIAQYFWLLVIPAKIIVGKIYC